MAKSRKLSATRMLIELIENGIEAEKRRQPEFFELAERFRSESKPDAASAFGPHGLWRLMPKIEHWENFPEGVRQHLIDRMRDRAITITDLNLLRPWCVGQALDWSEASSRPHGRVVRKRSLRRFHKPRANDGGRLS
ncbi:MAG: hypothetical protein JNL98_33415 [Bryobacterales bacterium]|nr:hypothetical protein [Bryobacterales bacterium]